MTVQNNYTVITLGDWCEAHWRVKGLDITQRYNHNEVFELTTLQNVKWNAK